MAAPAPKTPGYVGRRLAFIMIWMFVMMLPSGNSADSRYAEDPAFVLIVVLLALVVILVPPFIAARQIYRAFVNR